MGATRTEGDAERCRRGRGASAIRLAVADGDGPQGFGVQAHSPGGLPSAAVPVGGDSLRTPLRGGLSGVSDSPGTGNYGLGKVAGVSQRSGRVKTPPTHSAVIRQYYAAVSAAVRSMITRRISFSSSDACLRTTPVSFSMPVTAARNGFRWPRAVSMRARPSRI